MKKYSSREIYSFLKEVDNDFPVPLSNKVTLQEYAKKLENKATLHCVEINGKIVAMIAGYTENVINHLAYIAILAVKKSLRGKGISKFLIKEFFEECRKKELSGIHVYTHPTNLPAIKLYTSVGFTAYILENEARPNDLHLIKYL